MRKIIAVLAAVLFLLGTALLPVAAAKEEPVKILVTTFPIYDWMRNILGERLDGVQLSLLQDSGIDLHNFQPTVEDILTLHHADLFVYIGGPSDHWVEAALPGTANPGQHSLSLMEALGEAVKMELVVDGMQEGEHAHHHDHEEDQDHEDHAHEDHEDHDHEDHAHEDHEHQEGHEHQHADEHIWLSLKNAQLLVPALASALAQVDLAHADLYAANAAAYVEKLQALDLRYQQAIAQVADPVLLFGDRFPFRYLMDDYGIRYYAAFSGCSAETEASFQTIAFLADQVDALSLKAVLILDGSSERIAQAVVRTSKARDQQVLLLNSMQSQTLLDISQGANYLDIMEENLNVILQAL